MKKIAIISTLLLIFSISYSQSIEELIKTGDDMVSAQNFVEAIKTYSKAIDLNKTLSESYFKRGQAYFYWEQDSSSVQDFDKAISLDPKNPQIYYMRGQARTYLGNNQGALSDYADAIQLDSNYIPPYVKRGYLFIQMGLPDAAFIFFTIAIQKDPNQPADVYFARGYCYQQSKAYKQALDDYSKAIVLNPDYADAFLNSGNCAQQLNDLNKACAYWRKAVELGNAIPQVTINENCK
ncbi:MAG: tetratricopeptide repeat protein [Bacteroidetes bacterium]|nr:tetratricopeptide repeat protein [Bacteroidota bacterium]